MASGQILEITVIEEIIEASIVEESYVISVQEESYAIDLAPESITAIISNEVFNIEIVEQVFEVFVESWSCPGAGSGNGYYETFYGKNKNMKGRYLYYAGKLSNKVGLPILYNGNLTALIIKTDGVCSGWIRIRKNGNSLYSVEMDAQDSKIVTGLNLAVDAEDSISVFVESSNGVQAPTVRLHFT